MKKLFAWAVLTGIVFAGNTQELYVFSEPASNMPAHSVTPRLSASLGYEEGRLQQRYTPELMFGFSKKFMLHIGTSFSNMQSSGTRWEAVNVYGKYRFFSNDEVHRHFRMALFTDLSFSRNQYQYDEVNIQGDRSGVQLGLITTQLINRVAVSGILSHTQAFDPSRNDKTLRSQRSFESLNYSFSAGYLLLPREYNNYEQLNVNLYAELLGQKALDRNTYFVDLAPSIQFIFNSNSKLNLGYRFQFSGNASRNMERSFLVSLEHTFFNALKKAASGKKSQ